MPDYDRHQRLSVLSKTVKALVKSGAGVLNCNNRQKFAKYFVSIDYIQLNAEIVKLKQRSLSA